MKLTKHHGLGNDFLIHLEAAADLVGDEVRQRQARRWCDRRRGIGADGFIVARPLGGAQWMMKLWNSDGSRAELSGNGLRCLGQALARNDQRSRYMISTDAGVRTLTMVDAESGRARWFEVETVSVEVAMGAVSESGKPWTRWSEVGLAVGAQLGVDVGNPHLVAQVPEVDGVDLAQIGPLVEGSYPDGVNLEIVTVGGPGQIKMRVWERGVGITEACGSGAVASAYAARRWGLSGDRVEVLMPGGAVRVDLSQPEAQLEGPATFIAQLEVQWD